LNESEKVFCVGKEQFGGTQRRLEVCEMAGESARSVTVSGGYGGEMRLEMVVL